MKNKRMRTLLKEKQHTYFYHLLIILLLSLITSSCTKKPPENILASINGEIISVKDFSDSYFQIILYGNQFDSPENRLRHLNLLIDSYLLAQHGIKSKTISAVQLKPVEDRTRRRMIKEKLLHKEVELKTPVPTDNDLKKLYLLSTQKVHIRHLFAKTKDEIDSIHTLLRQGRTFESLAFDIFEDSLLKFNGGDLGWNQWGDLDPFLEDTAFIMSPKYCSRPIESRFGWHILKLENKIFNPITSEYNFLVEKTKLKKQFIRREQNKLYYRFINQFMQDKTAIIYNPEWSVIAREIRRRFPVNQKISPLIKQMPYSPEFGAIPENLSDIINNPIITFSDGALTVREFFETIPDIPPKTLYGSLKGSTETLIRNYFLTQEGIRQGLDKEPEVTNSIIFQRNLRAGTLYRKTILNKNSVDPIKIDNNIIQSEYDSLRETHFVDNRIFDFTMLVAWDSATAKICDSLLISNYSFKNIVREYGTPKAGVLKSGRFQKDRKDIPGEIRSKLLNQKKSEISDWTVLNKRLVRIQRHSIKTTYKDFDEVSENIRNEIAKRILKDVLYDSLITWRQESDIFIDEEKLKNLWKEED